MPLGILIAVAVITAALCVLTWLVVAGPDRRRERTLANLHRGLPHPAEQDEPAEGHGSGVLATLTRRLTPHASLRMLERLLMRAGRPPAWPVERLAAAKLLGAGVSATLGLLFLSNQLRPLTVLVAGATTIVCYFLPELLLHSRGQERNQKIALELADTLDQMTIAVEAGLGFDSAMARAGKNGTGPLADELIRTLQDIRLGQSRREAYESLASRTDVPDLRRFVRAIIQADAYGIAVADVLRTQAAEMRVKRRQRAEEKAMQIPVKVIFPLMMCILPVLFIVLLGPAVMDIVDAFS